MARFHVLTWRARRSRSTQDHGTWIKCFFHLATFLAGAGAGAPLNRSFGSVGSIRRDGRSLKGSRSSDISRHRPRRPLALTDQLRHSAPHGDAAGVAISIRVPHYGLLGDLGAQLE